MWVAFKVRVPVRVLLARVPHYFEDLKWDPDLEDYPCNPEGPCAHIVDTWALKSLKYVSRD